MMRPRCILCDDPTTDDNYCYGCGEFICDACDGLVPPAGPRPGPHVETDHRGRRSATLDDSNGHRPTRGEE